MRYQPGFTLIEMMITITILAVMLMIAAPSFQTFIRGQRVKTTSFDVYSALTYTRSEAMKRNGDVTISPISSNWSNGWNIKSGTTILRTQSNLSTSVTISGPTTITYGRDGRANASASIQVDPNPTGSGISPRCISIELSGRPNSKTGSC